MRRKPRGGRGTFANLIVPDALLPVQLIQGPEATFERWLAAKVVDRAWDDARLSTRWEKDSKSRAAAWYWLLDNVVTELDPEHEWRASPGFWIGEALQLDVTAFRRDLRKLTMKHPGLCPFSKAQRQAAAARQAQTIRGGWMTPARERALGKTWHARRRKAAGLR